MLKEKIRNEDLPLENKQAKWRNMYFDKTGASHFGKGLFESQNEAANIVAKNESIALNSEAKDVRLPMINGAFLLFSDVSWVMQMPILD